MLPCGLLYTLRSIAWLGWLIRDARLLHDMIATGLGTIEFVASQYGPPLPFQVA